MIKEKKVEKVDKKENVVKNDVASLKGLSVKKNENFSEWYSEVVQKCELADMRYNVKGVLVFQPWSVLSMEKMYDYLEKTLQEKGHKPYWYPTLIPESNLKKESSHIKGFTPEVFWVTGAGDDTFEEKYALRPTSETAFYQMFGIWIRSYKDLPFKTYQRANVFRYETKATRPFLRSREFYWVEAHCVHATQEDAMKQVYEDMETTKEVLHNVYGLPFIFFERPAWDKFPGAERTFAADVLNPDGKVVQQPSTHLLKQEFCKAFNVKFTDKDGKEKLPWITCYGPAISRIFASVIIVHGDDKGLRFPWEIAPVQVMIVPIKDDEKLIKKSKELKERLKGLRVDIDLSDRTAGEKFNLWEMKGVPVRIDLGFKDLEGKKLTVFRRDTGKKDLIDDKELESYVAKVGKEATKNLTNEADKLFEGRIADVKDLNAMKKAIESGKIARCGFCSVDMDGAKCAEIVEKEVGAQVRGTKLEKEKTSGNCVVCGKKAKEIVYVARQY
ncbi:MAG: proline--tRNA ligase [Nanoarchaeota archaeon]